MPRSKKGYEFFDHTADAGVRVYGATLQDLFIHAAQGLVELLVEDSRVAHQDTRQIHLTATSTEELLSRWLKELLFWFSTDRFVPAEYRLRTVSETALEGEVAGERFDPARHAQGVEVKGLTYHQFRVQRTDTGWEANMIFDV